MSLTHSVLHSLSLILLSRQSNQHATLYKKTQFGVVSGWRVLKLDSEFFSISRDPRQVNVRSPLPPRPTRLDEKNNLIFQYRHWTRLSFNPVNVFTRSLSFSRSLKLTFECDGFNRHQVDGPSTRRKSIPYCPAEASRSNNLVFPPHSLAIKTQSSFTTTTISISLLFTPFIVRITYHRIRLGRQCRFTRWKSFANIIRRWWFAIEKEYELHGFVHQQSSHHIHSTQPLQIFPPKSICTFNTIPPLLRCIIPTRPTPGKHRPCPSPSRKTRPQDPQTRVSTTSCTDTTLILTTRVSHV